MDGRKLKNKQRGVKNWVMNRGVKGDNNSHSESGADKVRDIEERSMYSNSQTNSGRVKEAT